MSERRDDPKKSHLHAVGRYPEAAVVEHLKRCQKITAQHCETLFPKFANALDETLQEFASNAKSNQEANRLQELVREFRVNAKDLRQQFINTLAEGFVKFKNHKLNTYTGEEKYQGDMLTLVDNEDLEETIAISSVARRAEEYYGEVLWFISQRFAMLNGGNKVDEHNNPVSPVQFCESLRKALTRLEFDTKAKIIAFKVFDKEFIRAMQDILTDVNRYLQEQNILPNLRYTNVQHGDQRNQDRVDLPSFDEAETNPGATAHPQSSPYGQQPLPQSQFVNTPDASAPTEEYQGRLVDAIRTLQNHIAGGSAPPGASNGPAQGSAAGPMGPAGNATVYSNQQLVTALTALQSQALSTAVSIPNSPAADGQAITPLDIAAIGQQLQEQLKEEAEDGKVDGVDMHTIELVGMLFEYMLSDEHLPDSIKAILSYLHTPFLKVAFLDPSFFEKTEHPARLLLNSLAEAGAQWVSNDGTSQYEIYAKVKQIVSRVLEDFEKDVRLFAELLLEFSSYVKKISRRQELMEKRALEKVQGEEKLREVKIRVNQEIRSRTDNKELPSAVLLLLLQPWSDYLAFLLLRYGEDSDLWKTAINAVDDLLWSIDPKEVAKDKSRQMTLLDDLLDVIENGFETIGYDQTKGKKLLEAIVSLQKGALQSQKAEPAPEPMREKLEAQAAEKAGDLATSKEKPTEEEAQMVENLKMIEFGTWFEFQGGKRLKVAWYNSKTMHYMLVDQMGKKVAMKSGLELARAMLKGEAKVIAGSTKPFFERALENIFHNLNARAESIKPEG